MFQESVSLNAESTQRQSYAEPTDSVTVDFDNHEGPSHNVEQFGIGLPLGFLLGGVADVIGSSLSIGTILGLTFGVVLGVYFMKRRRRRAMRSLRDLSAKKVGRPFRYGRRSRRRHPRRL